MPRSSPELARRLVEVAIVVMGWLQKNSEIYKWRSYSRGLALYQVMELDAKDYSFEFRRGGANSNGEG